MTAMTMMRVMAITVRDVAVVNRGDGCCVGGARERVCKVLW